MGILREVTLHFIRHSFPTLFSTLRVSLGRGHVDSTDVVLSTSDPISVSGIPWQIADGNISGLSLQLPWVNLGAKFSVRAKSAYIHITEVPFPTLQQLSINAITDELRRKKFRIVAEAERNQAPFGSSVRQIMSQVLERIELAVENFTAALELADGFVVTFNVVKLLAGRREASSTEQSRTLVISVEGISVIIKSPSTDSPVPLNIPDLSISLSIELDEHTLKLHLDVQRATEVSIHSSLREVVHSLKLRRAQWWAAYKWNRPTNCIRTNAVSWLRYAYRRISASHGFQRVTFDVQSVRQSLRSFVEYKNLHVKRLHTSRLKSEEVSRITELEESYDADLILLLRHAAKRHVAADEVSQFGTSEWLRWILFGHQISSERERLAADVKRSLEASTGPGSVTDVPRSESDHNRIERYAFQCSLNGLSGRVSAGNHELRISFFQLGFHMGLGSSMGQFNIGLDLEHLAVSVDGDIVARKQPLSKDGADRNHGTSQLVARLLHSSDRTSLSVSLQSMFVRLDPAIIESCSFVLQRWTSPLVPMLLDREQYLSQSYVQDRQSESVSVSHTNATWTVRNVHVLLFDDRIIYKGRSPALSIILNEAIVRSPPTRTSFIPELDGSLSLEGAEFDVASAPKSTAVPEAGNASFPRQQFLSFSTDLHLSWKATAIVKLSNSSGFIQVPTVVRVLRTLLRTGQKSRDLEYSTSERDRRALHSAPEPAFDISNIQERFARSGLLVVVSYLTINVLWDSRSLSHEFLLEIKQWESELSSRTLLLDGMRIGNICISSSAAGPLLTLIEPASDFDPAFRLKRGSHRPSGGHLFEVLIADVSVRLCPDVILAVTALVSQTVQRRSRSFRTVQNPSSSEASGRQITTSLLSLLVASFNVQWSYGQFHAEINCSNFQVTSERNEVSGSAETITLTQLNVNHGGSSSTSEVILHVTDPPSTNDSVVRFLSESVGFHIGLNNLTASAKRSFWDPLVLSIADVLEKVKERHEGVKVSNFEVSQDDDRGLPIRVSGSGLLVVLPILKLGSPQIEADVSHVSVLLQSGQQTLSFGRTAILINHVHVKSRVVQTASFEVQHKNVVALRDELLHYSDTWNLSISNEIALILSPNPLSTLRIGLADLLSATQNKERDSAGEDGAKTCADNSSSVSVRTRVVFRGSIKSIRLSLGISNGAVVSDEPFAVIEAQDLSLSSVDVRDGLDSTRGEVAVFSWLASCRILRLLKYLPSSPGPWRTVIGRDVLSLADNFSSPNHQGLSVRRISRQDHGRDTTTFGVYISDISILFDPDLFAKLSQFMRDCSNASRKTRKGQNKNHDHYHDREFTTRCGSSSAITEASSCSSTCKDNSTASNYGSRTKLDLHLANFTILYSLDGERDSVYCLKLSIRKTDMTLLMSSLLHPMNGSTVILEGISLWVNPNLEGAKRVLDFVTEERTPRGRIYTSEGPSDAILYHSGWFGSMSPSASLNFSRAVAAREMLVAAAGHLKVKLKPSPEDEFTVSIGNVWLETSFHSLLRLGRVWSIYGARSANAAQTFPYSSFAAPSRIRLHVESINLRLTVDQSPVIHPIKTAPNRRSMRIDLSASVRCLTDVRFQAPEGTLKMSLDLSDNKTGHRDPLMSPCLLRYQVTKRRECTIEVEIGQLLRMSFSPMTVRVVCALSAALEKTGSDANGSSSPWATAEMDSRFIIRIHGIAVRCLSDTPRTQVLRLLLGDLRFEVESGVRSGRRLLDCSIREFLLEDTVSWRLFRSGPVESNSRKWERIIASVRRRNEASTPLLSGPPQDLRTRDMRLHTTRVSYYATELPIHPAVQCHVTWREFFENLEARIDSSGMEINLDLVALPVIQEWYKSLVEELPSENSSSSQLRDQRELFGSEESQQIVRRGPSFSEIYIEPLSITGSIRAAPRRLQESLYERLLTRILDVDSVTDMFLQLPAVRILGTHENSVHVLHQLLLRYSLSTLSREFTWQILTQAGRLFRLARLFTLSFFRQRAYNPLRMATENTDTMQVGRRSDGLLVLLHSRDMSILSSAESATTCRPLIVERVLQRNFKS